MIWQKAVRTVVNSQLEHPEIMKKQCLNARQGKVHCDKCRLSCPDECITCPEKGEADWSNCSNCGICASVCPARAIELSRTGMTTIVQAVRLSGASRTIGCAEAAGDVDVRVPCLASLPWEVLAAMALAGKVHLVHGHCDACSFQAQFPLFDKALERAGLFLEQTPYKENLMLHAPGESVDRNLSRRRAFGAMLGKAARAADRRGTQDEAQTNEAASSARDLLLEAVRRQKPEYRFKWVIPGITARCWGCGICEKICPTQAIHFENPNGSWRLVLSHGFCTDCGVCEALCPEKAIEGKGVLPVEADIEHIVMKINARTCVTCGAPVRPESDEKLCIRCQAKNRRKRM